MQPTTLKIHHVLFEFVWSDKENALSFDGKHGTLHIATLYAAITLLMYKVYSGDTHNTNVAINNW